MDEIKVGVTGFGFVASHVVDALLRRGVRVACLTRNGAARGVAFENRDLLDVHLIQQQPSVDSICQAFEGCTAIVHAASPVNFGQCSYAESFRSTVFPSVQYTTFVFKAAERLKTVKRIVHISSTATIVGPVGGGGPSLGEGVFSEADHNLDCPDAYTASKVLSEFLATQLSGRTLLVTLNPGVVLGKLDVRLVGERIPASYEYVSEFLRKTVVRDRHFSVCDIGDLVRAIAAVALADGIVGGRYIVASGVCSYGRLLREVRSLGGRCWKVILKAKEANGGFALDNRRLVAALGGRFEYTATERTLRDTMALLLEDVKKRQRRPRSA